MTPSPSVKEEKACFIQNGERLFVCRVHFLGVFGWFVGFLVCGLCGSSCGLKTSDWSINLRQRLHSTAPANISSYPPSTFRDSFLFFSDFNSLLNRKNFPFIPPILFLHSFFLFFFPSVFCGLARTYLVILHHSRPPTSKLMDANMSVSIPPPPTHFFNLDSTDQSLPESSPMPPPPPPPPPAVQSPVTTPLPSSLDTLPPPPEPASTIAETSTTNIDLTTESVDLPDTAMDTSPDGPDSGPPPPATESTPDAAATPEASASAEDPFSPARSEDTPPPPPPPADPENASWADIEEDRSTPDEAELKEIESMGADYSALDCNSLSLFLSFSLRPSSSENPNSERALDSGTLMRPSRCLLGEFLLSRPGRSRVSTRREGPSYLEDQGGARHQGAS